MMRSEQLSLERIPVVILAGGMGTRLREETDRLPKPLLEIGDHPILWHIMKIYAEQGFRRFIVCLGYKSWLIKEYFLRHRERLSDFSIRLDGRSGPRFHNRRGCEDWEVTCVETGLHSGTGARLRLVRDYVDTETFMFTYGDGIGSIDLRALLAHHLTSRRLGTVTGVHPTSRYGEMQVAAGGHVVEFNEKPTHAEGFVSGGFFVFQKDFFDYLPPDRDLFLEMEPLQKLARDGQLSMFEHEGFWWGMDTYRDFVMLNRLWDTGQAPWKIWED